MTALQKLASPGCMSTCSARSLPERLASHDCCLVQPSIRYWLRCTMTNRLLRLRAPLPTQLLSSACPPYTVLLLLLVRPMHSYDKPASTAAKAMVVVGVPGTNPLLGLIPENCSHQLASLCFGRSEVATMNTGTGRCIQRWLVSPWMHLACCVPTCCP